MKLLITGGAGFIGKHIVNRLLTGDADLVSVFDNLSRSEPPTLRTKRLEFTQGDIRDVSDLRRAVTGCDVVIHLAAKAMVMGCEHNPIDAHDINATGTYNLLRLAREAGVHRVVIASSREVYGDVADIPVDEGAPIRPKNVYGATKAAAEMYGWWASSALEVTLLRLANVVGPDDKERVIPKFTAAATANAPLIIYGGGQILDFVSIQSVVEAFVHAALGDFVAGAINVASGVGSTILKTAHRIIEMYGSASAVQVLPCREAEVFRFVADITRLKCKLGIVPSPDPLSGLAAPHARACFARAQSKDGAYA